MSDTRDHRCSDQRSSDQATEPFHVVGKRTPIVGGAKKVTGEAVYTDDVTLPGMLHGRILRSPRPHARILRIDTRAARALDGVRGILTGAEAPRTFGVLAITKDMNALAVDKVRYVGDPVVAVAADTEAIAREACALVRVDYEDLPACLDPHLALQPAAEKIHAYTRTDTNVHKEVSQHFGDVDEAFRNAAWTASGTFSFVGLNHAFTEPQSAVAHFDADGRLIVWAATQVPHYLHRALAEVLEMPMHEIRVIKPELGGGFGGKSDPMAHEIVAALLARKTGRPVKLTYDREEVFLTNYGRHPTRTKLSICVDANRKIAGLDLDVLIDGGAYGSYGVVTTYYNGVLTQGPYVIPNFRYRGRRVYTNKPPCGAMRGHGAVNTRFAVEVLLDRLACDMGVNPADLRLGNLLQPNSTTANEFRITSVGIRECIERAVARSDYRAKWGRLPYGRGVGLGCGFYISGSALPIHRSRLPQSTVHIKVDMDGGVTLHTGASEIGQGSDTMVAQMAAEVLGLPMAMIRVKAVDTDLSPVDLGSYSSRVTFMAGNAAKRAAEAIRDKLVRAAARIAGGRPEDYAMRDAKVVHVADSSKTVDYFVALEEALADNGALIAKGTYRSPAMGGTYKGAGAGLSPSYSYQAFVAEVEVDPETGFVAVAKVWAAHDCGRVLNPIAVEGQIEGSVHMGLGQALTESLAVGRGHQLNANLLDYRTLTAKEMPPVDVILVESIDPEGPFGAKECGEGALAPIVPAVANAIYDAVGVRLSEVPMTPDRVLAAIEKAKEDAAAGVHTA